MCRLVALSSDKQQIKTHEYIFNAMMILSSRINNSHGTGLITQDGKKLAYIKSGESAGDFVLTKEWNACITNHKHTGLFGHARLASSDWRNGFFSAHPTEHAHPHSVTETTLLMHNGIFKEHAKIAKLLGTEPSKDITDTMLFARFLGRELGEKGNPTPEQLIETLLEAGACEYALMILSTGWTSSLIVRGDKDLYMAQSNYGLLLNTTRVNITDTVKETSLALNSMGHEVLTLEDEPTLLEQWTIYSLKGSSLEKLTTIPERVRIVNKPPVVIRPVVTHPAVSSQITLPGSTLGPDSSFNWDSVTSRAWALTKLDDLLPPVATREELVFMLNETHGTHREYWWQFSPRELEELLDLLLWAFDEVPECAPSAEKDSLWLDFIVAGGHHGRGYTTAGVIVPGFDNPYFLNTEEELRQLTEGGHHVGLEM